MTVDAMDHMTKEILAVVQTHRNDETLVGMTIPFEFDQVMYAYGSEDEFSKMLEDLRRKFGVYLVRINGNDTLQMFVNSVKLWMKVSAYVHEVIQHHRSDDLMAIGRTPIDQDQIMYSYGSSDEFKSIINDLEDQFGLSIDCEEIGENRVHEFVNHIYCLVRKEKEKEVLMEKHNWEPTDNQGYSMECTKCEDRISINETEVWNAKLDSHCPGGRVVDAQQQGSI